MSRHPFAVPDYDGTPSCAEADPERWFPEQGGSARDVKEICKRCEVLEPCLNWALDNDERFGIWGGLSQFELDKIRGRRWIA